MIKGRLGLVMNIVLTSYLFRHLSYLVPGVKAQWYDDEDDRRSYYYTTHRPFGVTSGQAEYISDSLNDTAVHILLDSLLDKNLYDPRIRPRSNDEGGVTKVTLDLYVRSISSIDEMAMEFSTDLLVRQSWTDQRMKYNATSPDIYVSGTNEVVKRIWKPDLFFANERSGYFHEITLPNTMLRLYPNGTILYSARFQEKTCTLQVSLTDKALVFRWKHPETQAIAVNADLKLPKFNLSRWSPMPCKNEHYTGNFSCLRAQFVFKRELGYHFVQSYIPNILLVIASWISFWLDVDAIPARVTLGVTTLLTTTAQGSNIRDILPPVSYTKAIDVWVGTCTFFVFAALIEFAIVNLMARKDTKKAIAEARSPQPNKYSPVPSIHHQPLPPSLIRQSTFQGFPIPRGNNGALYSSPLGGGTCSPQSLHHHSQDGGAMSNNYMSPSRVVFRRSTTVSGGVVTSPLATGGAGTPALSQNNEHNLNSPPPPNMITPSHPKLRKQSSADCPDCGEPLVEQKEGFGGFGGVGGSDPDFGGTTGAGTFLFERPTPTVELIDKPRAKMVDKVARILFPLAFVFFTVSYSLVYGLIKGDPGGPSS